MYYFFQEDTAVTLAVKPNHMKLLLPAASILGLTLRATLYAIGVDEKGLLVTGHWTGICVWLLTAAVAVMLFLWCRRLTGSKNHRKAYPASMISAAGSILAGVAIVLSSAPEAPSEALAGLELVLRFVAAASLCCVGFCRFTGKKPFFLLHCVVCLYLALRLVFQYRIWSSDPQMQNYCFYLGAHVALMLTAYQMAAFDAGLGDLRYLWGSGLAAVYLCILSIAGSGESFFLICCAIWIWTNLSRPSTQKIKTNHHTTQEESQ